MDNRKARIDSIIADKHSRVLEIGPLNWPLVTKDIYPNSFYCDIRSTQQVKALYSGNDYLNITGIHVDIDSIVDIDYVLKDSYRETFAGEEKFDYIVASHVIEHVEDILSFFQDITSVIKPGGSICIYYPDLRYCFDHFRQSASFRDAYDVYMRGCQETSRMVLDFYFKSIAENDPAVFWRAENLEELLPANSAVDAIEAYRKSLAGVRPDDVHFWPFTDQGFLYFLCDCIRAGLMPFTCVQFSPTQENTQEFFIELRLDTDPKKDRGHEIAALKAWIASLPPDFQNSKQLTLSRENPVLIAQNQELSSTNEALRKQNFELAAQNQELSSTNEALRKQNFELAVQNQEQESNIGWITIQMREQAARNDELVSLLEEEREQGCRLLQELQSVRSSFHSIENSTIWRVTRPARIVLDFIKKLFNRNKGE
ncbi:methyltransferase family protein [Desulfitobacterium dehalogenans ATCC 51507]|uniref:Methyltransferase family protein n=1 Tax=Desulfitobacterium dehalogenans (strain ATCC 51507 / DSM 9161 / JW/IU-DC1) TaxID=756499 RepID=I4ADR8_DESDJ|nr:methyltransferase domain-containing protein [Desulfitobacterium dehalogenans]AFM02103.1 methyltransferase family protein [Desulfitobacterium dehalogenans ATCC 51507]